MAGEFLNPLLAYCAGVLTILSPCVLPLVPVILGSAAQKHRWGPLALAAGLVGGFTAIGFLLAVFGSSLGIDPNTVRLWGAVILTAAGIFLLASPLQSALASVSGPLTTWASERQQRFDDQGLFGQTMIGLLLGLVWSPCVGPTLGAAVALASQGEELAQVAATMAAFSAGIATVLLVVAFIGRNLFNRVKGSVATTAKSAKLLLGAALLAVGLLILTGIDRMIEGYFVTAAPDWLIRATTAL